MSNIRATFSINAAGTVWGAIDGDISNQTDLQDALDLKANKSELETDIEEVNTSISNLSDTVLDNYNTLDDKIDTEISNRISADTTLQNNIDTLSDTVSNNYTILDTKINDTKTSLEGNINDLSDTVSQNYTDLNNAITTSASTINSRINSEVSTLNTAISTETVNRQNADNNLQSQIDAIVSSSDVFDIVGTYAELQAYDISTVPVNDVVKVLVDSSHNNAATYYRCIETAGVKSWSYIGSEGAYYTKSESDTKFVAKTTTINNKPLSSNITLTASDVNALPNTTTIEDLTTTAQQNALNSGATSAKISQIATNTGNITTNANAISTINGKIPTDASSNNKLVTTSALSNAVVNLANQDLSNLTETGNDRLHALKSYSDNGELLTDAEGLSDITKFAHSTFDLSKFTVVGNPVITDDGIASGFSTSNYFTLPYDWANNCTNFKFNIKFHTDTLSNTKQYLIGYTSNGFGCGLNINSSNKLSWYAWRDTDYSAVAQMDLTTTLSNNTDYIVECILNNGVYSLNLYDANNILIESKTANTSYNFNISSRFRLGNDGQYYIAEPFINGSIDLKQFSITVDGQEVFNGLQEGMDVLKPNNFTTVTDIYAYKFGDNTVYSNVTDNTNPTELYNDDGSYYLGTAFQILNDKITYPEQATRGADDITIDGVTYYEFEHASTNIYADDPTNPTTLYNSDGTEYTQTLWNIMDNKVYYLNFATYTSASNVTVTRDYNTVDAGVKISEDGITTITRSGQSIKFPITGADMLNKNWSIEGTVLNTGNKWGGGFNRFFDLVYGYGYTSFGSIAIYRQVDNKLAAIQFQAKIGDSTDSTGDGNKINKDINRNDSDWESMRYILKFNYTSKTYSLYYALNNEKLQLAGTYTATIPNPNLYRWNIDSTTPLGIISYGGHDLNSIKIYVDGNLVYQPCLKIPYTESKTGSKIVNAIYRDRVNDMASQFGYANYYTLDEDNGNFTLPQVELFGLIGDKTLRDSYYNGATYWELYSNRRLEQGGSCESGVEYTFPKPFADTNYILTIPYSSKTATSFIPSATGDFIAKGTGLL